MLRCGLEVQLVVVVGPALLLRGSHHDTHLLWRCFGFDPGVDFWQGDLEPRVCKVISVRDGDDELVTVVTVVVNLEFTDDGIDTIANIANEVNSTVENIGARRLHTIIERVLDEISFTATDRAGEKITIDSDYIKKNIGELVKDTDLSKFIL